MDDAARANLEKLDKFHMQKGDYEKWMVSEERMHFAEGQKVRVLNSMNMHELCEKAGLDERKVRLAYQEALETGDVLFVMYEEEDASTN